MQNTDYFIKILGIFPETSKINRIRRKSVGYFCRNIQETGNSLIHKAHYIK